VDSFRSAGEGTEGRCTGGGGRGELLLLFFIGSWRGLTDGGGGGERGRGFIVESGKETRGWTGLEGTSAAGACAGVADAGVNLLVIAGGRGLGGLTGLAEPRAKTESDLVLLLLLLVVVLVLMLFEVGERGSGAVVLIGLSLLASRGEGTGRTDFAGGGGSGGGDFDGLGERASGSGGGLTGLGGVRERGLCGLDSLDPSGLFEARELADPWALALAVGLEGTTEIGPYVTVREGRGGGGKIGLTAIWWGGEGNGPASDIGTRGFERGAW
jgi:hypothetical protein